MNSSQLSAPPPPSPSKDRAHLCFTTLTEFPVTSCLMGSCANQGSCAAVVPLGYWLRCLKAWRGPWLRCEPQLVRQGMASLKARLFAFNCFHFWLLLYRTAQYQFHLPTGSQAQQTLGVLEYSNAMHMGPLGAPRDCSRVACSIQGLYGPDVVLDQGAGTPACSRGVASKACPHQAPGS